MLYVLWEISDEWYMWKGSEFWGVGGVLFNWWWIQIGRFSFVCLLTPSIHIQEQLCETNTNLLYF